MKLRQDFFYFGIKIIIQIHMGKLCNHKNRDDDVKFQISWRFHYDVMYISRYMSCITIRNKYKIDILLAVSNVLKCTHINRAT